MCAKLLIVEDDQDINSILSREFAREGFDVYSAWSGTEGRMALVHNPDIVIMDLMLPGINGEELISYIDEEIPVIALSAKSSSRDKVNMLKSGCIDYVTKPFDLEELKARVNVHLKSSYRKNTNNIYYGGLNLCADTRTVYIDEKTVHLTRTEFAVLKLLVNNRGRVISKSQIMDSVGEDTPDLVESSLKVHISNIRKKLKNISDHDFIEAVWGIGFRFVPVEES